MDKKDFAIRVMQEVGLEVDKQGYLVDQDTGSKIQYKGKDIKVDNVTRNDVFFDPLENQNVMGSLFNYHLGKLAEEDEDNYVKTYYPTNKDKYEKGSIEVQQGNNKIKSTAYYNDSLKYADMIITLNGSTKEDFSELDKTPIKTEVLKKRK